MAPPADRGGLASPTRGTDLILAIDPGLDELGWALFRPLAPGVLAPPAIQRAYCASGICAVSAPGSPTVQRLERLAEVARRLLLSDGGVARVVIEQPAQAGAYRRHLPHQRTKQHLFAEDMTLLYLAVGVLVTTALVLGREVELWPASSKPKLLRLQIIAGHWPRFRVTKVYTQGGTRHAKGSPKPDDETDAVYLGLEAATCRRQAWAGAVGQAWIPTA